MNRGTGSRIVAMVLTLGLTGMGLLFLAFVMDEGRIGTTTPGAPPPVLPMLAIAGGAAICFALFRGPVGKGIARLFESHDLPDEQLAARLEQVEDRLAELGADQLRVGELEERLDFAERLLAQRTEPAALPRNGAPP